MTQTFLPPRPRITRGLRLFGIAVMAVLVLLLLPVVNGLLGALNLQYGVTADAVQVRYGLRTVQIPLGEVTGVRVVERPTGAVRWFGVATGGLKTGRWQFAQMGTIDLYATQLDRLVLIEAGPRRLGLTPADPQGFMQAIAAGTPGRFPPAGHPARAALGMAVAVGVMLLAIAVVGFALRLVGRFARELRYELGPEGLTIWTGWRPVRIAYRDVQGAEIASPGGNPLKLYGAQFGDVLWGSFRWPAAGPNLRLYATRAKPLVLLHLRGRTVGINPEEDERFVAALRARLR